MKLLDNLPEDEAIARLAEETGLPLSTARALYAVEIGRSDGDEIFVDNPAVPAASSPPAG